MVSRARNAAAPAYLFACLLLGGSAQGIWQNAILQIVGLGIIAWAAVSSAEPVSLKSRGLLLLAVVTIAWIVLQAIPLPTTILAHGKRAGIYQGLQLLGQPASAMTISLSPYSSLAALFCLIPPLALFCAMVRLTAYRASWLAMALLAGAIAGVLLGALQVATANQSSPWYLYPDTKFGAAVGFFANANHMALLLVVCLPFTAAIGSESRHSGAQRSSALLAVLAAAAIILIVGVALNGSLAGYGLLVPVTLASLLILIRLSPQIRRFTLLGTALLLLVAVAGLSLSSIGGTKIGKDARTSVTSRTEIMTKTGAAIADFMPFGTGLGTFAKVYRLYESPDVVTNEYVVHAHNDYAEVALELGVPGVLLLIAFLTWWARAAWPVWGSIEANPYARAASVASAAILVHSIVDFPLRTASISAVFAMCLALLAERRPQRAPDASDLRPTRHLVIS